MTVAASPPYAQSPAPPSSPATETCPLCGGPLHPAQEWCLRCGAAARTRLAAAPGWRGPLAVFAVVVALSLGVLAAAFVKLAADSGPATTRTTTVAGPATAATVPSPAGAAQPPPTTPSPATAPTIGAAQAPGPGAATATATTTRPPAGVLPGLPKSVERQLRRLRAKAQQ